LLISVFLPFLYTKLNCSTGMSHLFPARILTDTCWFNVSILLSLSDNIYLFSVSSH
jgi:hypothetical protein